MPMPLPRQSCFTRSPVTKPQIRNARILHPARAVTSRGILNQKTAFAQTVRQAPVRFQSYRYVDCDADARPFTKAGEGSHFSEAGK